LGERPEQYDYGLGLATGGGGSCVGGVSVSSHIGFLLCCCCVPGASRLVLAGTESWLEMTFERIYG